MQASVCVCLSLSLPFYILPKHCLYLDNTRKKTAAVCPRPFSPPPMTLDRPTWYTRASHPGMPYLSRPQACATPQGLATAHAGSCKKAVCGCAWRRLRLAAPFSFDPTPPSRPTSGRATACVNQWALHEPMAVDGPASAAVLLSCRSSRPVLPVRGRVVEVVVVVVVVVEACGAPCSPTPLLLLLTRGVGSHSR